VRVKKNQGESTVVAPHDKPVFNVADLVRMGVMSRTQIYLEHRAGRLPFRKMGKRTLILREDFENWLKALPKG